MKYDLSHGEFEETKGSGDYMTLREAMTRGGAASKIPDYEPEYIFRYIVEEYWELKCNDIDHRITKSEVADTLLDRNERAIILAMDKAFLSQIAKERKRVASKQ